MHALVSNKQKGPARCCLTCCLKSSAHSCQQRAERVSQMLTYSLFKSQSILLSATDRKGQPKSNSQPIWNPEHAFVSNKQERPVICWLTSCSKPRASPCQQQAGRASQMLTYILFKSQNMLFSAKAGRTSQMLTYMLFKTQSMLLSATSRKGQPDPDLHSVQHPEHDLVSNKQEGPARSWLTSCSKPRACSHQQQAGRASQILTYILFKTQSMLLSASSRKGQPDPDLLPVQNPEYTLVSNKEEGPARSWLTNCLNILFHAKARQSSKAHIPTVGNISILS